MAGTSHEESKRTPNDAAQHKRAQTFERLAILYARIALGAAFLSGIADRFGLYWGRNVGYGNFAGFVRYTAQVNSFMPPPRFPFSPGLQPRPNSSSESR